MSEQEIGCDATEPEEIKDTEGNLIEKVIETESQVAKDTEEGQMEKVSEKSPAGNPLDLEEKHVEITQGNESSAKILVDAVEKIPQPSAEKPVIIAEDNDIPQYSSDENESFDSSSSDSSSSSDESDGEAKEERPVMEEEDTYTGPILSKNEVNDDVIPEIPVHFEMTENTPIEHVGEIMGHAEHSLLIKASVSGEERILEENSILCLEDRTVLGLLFETFGKLESPIYLVRFKDDEDFKKFSQLKGAKVFFVVPQSKFVNTKALRAIKGSDASNCHDEEVPEEEQEFSDDEKELLFKQARKRSKRGPKRSETTEQKSAQPNLYSQLKSLPSRKDGLPYGQNQSSQDFVRNDPVSVHQQMQQFQQQSYSPVQQQSYSPVQQQSYSPVQLQNLQSGYSHPMNASGAQYNNPGMAQYNNQGGMGAYNNPGMAQAQYQGMAPYNPGMTQYNNYQQPYQQSQGYAPPANNLSQAQLLYLQQAMYQQMAGQMNQNPPPPNQQDQSQNQPQNQYPQGDMY